MRARRTLILLAIWAMLGLAIKHLRYSDPASLDVAGADAALQSFMSRRGWETAERITLSPDLRYVTTVFKKNECADPVAMMLIDTGDSISTIFEHATNADVVYVEHGAPDTSAPTARLLARIMWNSLKSAIGLGSVPAFPIVAVAPKTALGEGPCGVPLIRDWTALASAGAGRQAGLGPDPVSRPANLAATVR